MSGLFTARDAKLFQKTEENGIIFQKTEKNGIYSPKAQMLETIR